METTTTHEQRGRTRFTNTVIPYSSGTAEVTTTFEQHTGHETYEVTAWLKYPESRALVTFVTPTGERVPAYRKVYGPEEAAEIHAAFVAEFTDR